MRNSSDSRVHLFVLTLVLAGFTVGAHAQRQFTVPAAMVAVTGTAESGGEFVGTLLVARFDSKAANDGLVAVGSMHGLLNGRNVVTRVSIPITLTAASDLPAAPGSAAVGPSCDAVRVDLIPTSFRVVDSLVTLDAAGFDIIGAAADAPAVVGSLAASAVRDNDPTPAIFRAPTAMSQPATTVPTAPTGSLVPGVVAPAAQATHPVAPASAQQLAESLCSVSTLIQSSSSPAQIAPLLNRVLDALRQ